MMKGVYDFDKKTKVMMFFYYSGHGVLDMTTKIVLNEIPPETRYWPLESIMSNLAMLRDTYTVGLFDCCREEFKVDLHFRGG